MRYDLLICLIIEKHKWPKRTELDKTIQEISDDNLMFHESDVHSRTTCIFPNRVCKLDAVGFTSFAEKISNSGPWGTQASTAGSRAQRTLLSECFDCGEERMYHDSIHTVNYESESLISI